MNLAELKEAYKARKLALDSAKKEEEKYKALLKDAMLEAGESDYTDEAGYRFERIVQERKSMDEEKLLAELHAIAVSFGDPKEYYLIEDNLMEDLYKSREALRAVIDAIGGVDHDPLGLESAEIYRIRELIKEAY